jgi:hypothetical protein
LISIKYNTLLRDIKRVLEAPIVEEEVEIVPIVEEKGILGILNAFLKKQVGATEIDLAG